LLRTPPRTPSRVAIKVVPVVVGALLQLGSVFCAKSRLFQIDASQSECALPSRPVAGFREWIQCEITTRGRFGRLELKPEPSHARDLLPQIGGC
jgi:hypothetical protein